MSIPGLPQSSHRAGAVTVSQLCCYVLLMDPTSSIWGWPFHPNVISISNRTQLETESKELTISERNWPSEVELRLGQSYPTAWPLSRVHRQQHYKEEYGLLALVPDSACSVTV